jgi:hypothetical protein
MQGFGKFYIGVIAMVASVDGAQLFYWNPTGGPNGTGGPEPVTGSGGAPGMMVSNGLITYVWAGAGTINAPNAAAFPDFVIGVNSDGASTGLVYHVINGAWVATGATVANLYGA